MTVARRVRALWQPSWYNLDQSLRSGALAQLRLCPLPPDQLAASRDGGIEIRFHNDLNLDGDETDIGAVVENIHHPDLGDLLAIETGHLGLYVFVTASGRRIEVDAEQFPGASDAVGYFDGYDWSVVVTLSIQTP